MKQEMVYKFSKCESRFCSYTDQYCCFLVRHYGCQSVLCSQNRNFL